MMKDEEVIGQIRYGYKPQYVFDAVNEILQPENWRYEIVSKEICASQTVVEVKLFIRIANDWLCKGSHTGQMQIIRNNVGDAYKGAITDAIQKCFSLLSVGSDAYRGLLQEVYFGYTEKLPVTKASNSQPPSLLNQGQPPNSDRHHHPQHPVSLEPSPKDSLTTNIPDGLPEIAGIEYERINGRIIAMGRSYNKRSLLKSSGFKWDGSEKNWYKEVAVH